MYLIFLIRMRHIPVLLQEVIDHIPTNAQTIIDGTTGHGWHTQKMAELYPNSHIFAIDRDPNILQKAKENTQQHNNIKYIHDSYANIDKHCPKADFILLDIGVNREHFEDKSRWFSIHDNAPLDMRFDTTQTTTAQDIINKYSHEKLKEIFIQYADFTGKKAEEITNQIIKARKNKTIQTTQELMQTRWECGIGKNASSVLFQAIRIEVNEELEQLQTFLAKIPKLLNIHGRCAIITFHSIEDRIVKNCFKQYDQDKVCIQVNKKAIKPSRQEIQKNKASRSSVLRVIEKI